MARECGTPSLLAAAVAGGGLAAAGGEVVAAEAEAEAETEARWQRVPIDMRPVDSPTLENAPLSAALAAEPALWRSFTPAELSAFGLAPLEELAGRYIRVGEPGAQFWYHPFDVEAAQSPSAHGAPNEGALYGFRPLLYPWPPAALLFGSFAAAILSSYSDNTA